MKLIVLLLRNKFGFGFGAGIRIGIGIRIRIRQSWGWEGLGKFRVRVKLPFSTQGQFVHQVPPTFVPAGRMFLVWIQVFPFACRWHYGASSVFIFAFCDFTHEF